MPAVSVKHNFEAAHRLPHLPGKCVSLHGHSWWAEITAEAPHNPKGDNLVVEFGAFKKAVRAWIDEHLDHGVMLGPEDPLVPILRDHDTKVYEIDGWPTVENVADRIAAVAQYELLPTLQRMPRTVISRVHITETHVNAATWTNPATIGARW